MRLIALIWVIKWGAGGGVPMMLILSEINMLLYTGFSLSFANEGF